ncbi:MAG: LamG-like jellyroll fold domain-containing protein [Rhodospirillales bacterium]
MDGVRHTQKNTSRARAHTTSKPFTPLQQFGIVVAILTVIGGIWLYSSGKASTFLGVTLTTNPALETGLLAHWTFDGDTLTPVVGSASSTTGTTTPGTNAAVAGRGDGNGFELSQGGGSLSTVNNNGRADISSGTGNLTDGCGTFPQGEDDLHGFSTFNLTVPTNATAINGIQVALNASSTLTGTNPLCVALSWNAGGSTTTAKSNTDTSDTVTRYAYGSPSDTWGRSWSVSDFADANFRVYIMPDTNNSNARNFFLDYLGVEVTYTAPATTTQAADRTPGGKHLSLVGGSPTPGPIGGGYFFDGTDDFAATSTAGSISGIKTIAFWANFSTSPASKKIINIDGTDQVETNGSGNITATSFPGTTVVYVDGSSASANIPRAGEWHHVVITDTTGVNATNFQIGRVGATYGGLAIDDLRLYSTVLAQGDITRLYHLGATTKVGVTLNTNQSLANGLVAHYTFDGKDIDLSSSTREILDRSGNGNHGNWNNHASTTVPGVLGQALVLDGVNDNVSLGDINALDGITKMTVSAWIKQDTLKTGAAIITKWTASNNHFYFGTENSCIGVPRLVFRVDSNGSGCVFEETGHQAGVWEHWVMVFDGTQSGNARIEAYKNGAAYTLAYGGTITSPLPSNVDPVAIGDDLSGTFNWNGSLDDVRVYNRALSVAEIKRLYELGATTRVGVTLNTNQSLANGLVAHYTFDGKDTDLSSSTREILDRSGNGNHGNWLNHATTTVPGVLGQALSFDGVDDEVESQTSIDWTGAFSFAFWIRTTNSYSQTVMGWSPYRSCGPWVGVFNCTGAGDSATGVLAVSDVMDGRWHHIVYTATANAQSLYVDGVLEDTSAETSATNDGWPVMIGNRAFASEYFNGALDDVRIYNRTLSQDEITRLYDLGR